MKITLDKHSLIDYKKIMEREELKKWREKTGYSQGQLALILGVEVMTVSRWERGIMRIPSFMKWALAYLELRGDELKPKLTRKKGGKENGNFSGVSDLPQKAKRK
ncbi:MAG: hypothetical protein COX51_08305 [Syntrophobacteraceae bacterium CG23_combo_of_CG06-09_8_20_14_all_50_8]|nr:MAG: hypothetical protein COX51_08305 [Syntrophobacteraceae bacterium CG23_combo_of_CG06-09_8_20_14_all_50_8]